MSIAEALEKVAEISTSPRTFFVHVRVPEHVVENLREVQKRVIPDASKHQDIDHITLVYTRKPLEDHPPDKVHAALSALRSIGESTEPIDAKLQGWGFFDGAMQGGKPSTALVALVDAPGLEHLHVDMVRKLKDLGVAPSDLHVFTPHITLGYLGHHGRVDGELPPLSAKFTIDKAHVASRDHHEIPLTGAEQPIWQKAASYALEKDAARAGMRQITNALGAGETALANRLATTPGVLKPSAAGSQIRHLGSGMEGTSTLVAHPEHGISVRKVYDPQGLSDSTMIANKAEAGRALQGNPYVAQFKGETPTGVGPAHFYEHVPNVEGPNTPSSFEVATRVRAERPAGMRLHDVHEGNIQGGKAIDYLPVKEKGPLGWRPEVRDRAEAAQAALQHGEPHAFTNYLKDPARPGNLMAQAFRGAKPLVQQDSPVFMPKRASLGEEAAEFAMNPRDLRVQHRDAPGKGETSPVVGMAPIQGSC